MNLVTHIISIIKKERVYYQWNAYKITFFTVHFFSGIFSVNGWCDHLTQDWKITHVQAWTACGHFENCFVVTVDI